MPEILQVEPERSVPGLRSLHRSPRFSHEQHVLFMALLGGLPGSITAFVMLWTGDYTAKVQWTLTVVILLAWLGFSFALKARVIRPLQTLSNLLAALREGDYALRARGASREDALGEVLIEVNSLGHILRDQRLGALEATALLRTVMAEIDVAVFAIDGSHRLKLVNRAAERLLGSSADKLVGSLAGDVGLEPCLDGEPTRTVQMTFPGGSGRWGVRRSTFWEKGLPHQLIVLTDLSRALREEERQAWQRLIRVLGHELNNSLAPIKSISSSMTRLLKREPLPEDWRDDALRGLEIVGSRAESLNRFMTGYARLARLPPPRIAAVDLEKLVGRVVGLETRLPVQVGGSPRVRLAADADQLEQLLINLVRNAVDAVQETGGGVRIDWSSGGGQLELRVQDEGPGLSNTANLFVPFFTTKQGGSGIGLVLCRQIAEAHGGWLSLGNRTDRSGCVARLVLPV